MLGLAARVQRDDRGERVIGRDGERGRDVDARTAVKGERVGERASARASIDIGSGTPLGRAPRSVGEEHATRDRDQPDASAPSYAPHVPDEDDGARAELREARRRAGRGRREPDAHGLRDHVERAHPRAQRVAERRAEGRELRRERGHDEDVARIHRRGSIRRAAP